MLPFSFISFFGLIITVSSIIEIGAYCAPFVMTGTVSVFIINFDIMLQFLFCYLLTACKRFHLYSDMVDRETTSASQYERIHTPNMSINKKYRNRLQNQRQKQNPWEHFESDSSSDSTDNFDYGSDDRAEYSRRQHRIPSNYTRTHFLHNKRRSHRRQCNYDGNLIPSCEGGSPDREMYRRLQNEEEMQQSMQEQLYFPKRIDVEHADDIILSDAESLRSHESTDSEDVAGVSLTMSETIYQSSPTESADDLDTTALDDPLQSSPLRSHGRCPQPSVTAIEEKLSKQHKHRSIGTTELSSIHRKRKFYEPLQRSRKKCMEHRSALHQRAFRKTGKSKQSKIAKGLPRIVKMLNDQSDFRISQSCHLFPDVDDILQSCQSDSFSLSQYTKSGQTSIRDLGSASVSARQIEIALADQSLVDNDSEQTHVYKQHGKINNFIRQQQMKQPLSKQQFELPVYGLTPSTLSTSILPQDNQQSLCFIQCAIKATNDVLLFPVNRVCNTTDDMFDMVRFFQTVYLPPHLFLNACCSSRHLFLSNLVGENETNSQILIRSHSLMYV